ncbi:1-deoxy-D-xylulose-5-phosphate synthase N-terminal domain-containing protein [Apirhabdus apintestini]|nr:1-deoxy-D-xylulose-5-phosphate synthase N-terminal domain-containing protein [Enterobacteriaceae bacterium CA-0114]
MHPFPWRDESEYDVLSVGHSSTSISAGIGIAVAAEKEGKDRRTVCVIGDGAITAGMAFEAMNHAGDIRPNMLVVLNDNEMSISENVGALNNHLAQILSGKFYSTLREGGKKSSPACHPSKSCLNVQKSTLKAWWFPALCLKNWALITSAPLTDTMFWGWSRPLKICAT